MKRDITDFILICQLIFSNNLFAKVKISELQRILPAYKIMLPDKIPMFFKGESYQAVSKEIYPFVLNDMISNEKVDQAWKAFIPEN